MDKTKIQLNIDKLAFRKLLQYVPNIGEIQNLILNKGGYDTFETLIH